MVQIQISNSFTERTIRSVTKKGKYNIEEHIHQNPEILIVKDGYIDVTVDGKTERAYKDDVVIIAPFKNHSFMTEEFVSLWLCIFSGDFISDFSILNNEYSYGERAVFTPEKEVIDFVMTRLLETGEIITKLPNETYRRVKAAIYAIFEEYTSKVPQKKEKSKNTALSSILTYLLEHYKENITLKDVSKNIGYTTTYISHCLESLGDINFRTLLNSYRVEQAKAMLLENKHKMIDIALECGFGCERTFYRAFYSIAGVRPKDYKNDYFDKPYTTLAPDSSMHLICVRI